MRRLSYPVALAAIALAGLGGGCGDDESPAAEYRADANALCTEAERALEALPQPGSEAQLERYLDRAVELGKEYDRRFAALEPPDELRAQHSLAVRLSRRGERILERLADDLSAGTPPQEVFEESLEPLLRLSRQNNRLMRRMGLSDCVEPLPIPGAQPS